MTLFITHTETDRKRDSNGVRFFMRELSNGDPKSLTLDQEIQHTVVSREFSNQETSRLFRELEGDSRYEDFTFEKLSYGVNKSFIRAVGPRDRRHDLPDYFLTKHADVNGDPNSVDSPSRMVRWGYSPLSIVDLDEGNLTLTGSAVGIEQILEDRKCVIDVELKDWTTEHPEVSAVVFFTDSYFGNYLLSRYDPGTREIDGAKVEVFDTQEGLVDRLRQLEREFDPLWVGGHNIPQDKKWLRDLPDDLVYTPGVDNSKPIVKSAQRRSEDSVEIKKMVTKGRFTVDTYRYATKYLNFLSDNRLETHATRAGFPYEKIINYDELAELIEGAEGGDQQAARILLQYTLMDGEASFRLMEHILPNVALKMATFHTDSDTVTSKSKLGLGYERWQRKFFNETGTFDNRHSRRYYSTEGRAIGGLGDSTPNLERLTSDIIKRNLDASGKTHLIEGRDGFFDEVHAVYLTPFIKAFSPVIGNDLDLRMLLSKMRGRDHADLKYDLAQTMNAALVTPTSKLHHYLIGAGYELADQIGHPTLIPKSDNLTARDWAFGKTYGIELFFDGTLGNQWNINQNLFYAFHGSDSSPGLLEFLEQADVVSYSDGLVFLQGDIDQIKRMENAGLLVHVGSGPAISTDKKTVAKIGDTPVYQGFLPRRGAKSLYEVDLAMEFIETALNGATHEDLYGLLESGISRLDSGEVPKDKLLFRRKGQVYGKIEGTKIDVESERFMAPQSKPDTLFYKSNLRKNFGTIFETVLPDYLEQLNNLFSQKTAQLKLF